MSVSAKPDCIEYRNRLKFSTIFQYTVSDHTIEDVESDNYFHAVSQRYLRAGDEVYVCVQDKDNQCWHKASFEVVSTSATETIVQRLNDWRTGGLVKKPASKTPKTPASKAA